MADEDEDQKTEQPTGKRLGEARDRGQLPISREASSWGSMLGILTVIGLVLPSAMMKLVDVLRPFIESPESFEVDDRNVQTLLLDSMGQVAMVSGLIFLIMGAAAIFGVMVQTGFFFALDLIGFDLMKLSPMSGVKKLFSPRSLVELGKSMVKMVVMGAAVYAILAPIAMHSPGFAGMALPKVMAFLHSQLVHLIIVMLLIFTLVAAVDLFYTRFQYIKNLRMTKAEVKDEYKQQEGDPKIKSRLRQMRLEKARKRMMSAVPKADVVITNPTHYAVALQYDGVKMTAPVVLAKGINLIADRIRELAEEHRVPLVSNPPLSRALYDTVDVDRQIPAQHYRAVAEVISYVYKLKKRKF
ncbi:MAG: flagellar biosynthesis protein FlhB [Alphaproteobacteria bacterium]|nr:flagellar biosynthesis protein FlhB [Alphaproteobacteria bacterium]